MNDAVSMIRYNTRPSESRLEMPVWYLIRDSEVIRGTLWYIEVHLDECAADIESELIVVQRCHVPLYQAQLTQLSTDGV